MISRQSSFQRIKDKFDALKRFSLEEYVDSNLPSSKHAPATHPELGTAVEVRLWKVLQSKFQDRGKAHRPTQLDWTDDYFDRSLKANSMIEPDDSFAEDITDSCQGESFEDLHDEESEYMLEDITNGSFFADCETMEHDVFDDLLWERSLTTQDSSCFRGLKWEQSMSPGDAQSIDVNSPFTDLESSPVGESVEHPLDAVPWSAYENTQDDLLDVHDLGHHNEELGVAGPGHQDGSDFSLPNDISADQVSRSFDLASDYDFQHEMMMDN
jgi:hypothetical protein